MTGGEEEVEEGGGGEEAEEVAEEEAEEEEEEEVEEGEGIIYGGFLDVICSGDFERGGMFFGVEKDGGIEEEDEEDEEEEEIGMFFVFLDMPNNRSVPLDALFILFPTPPVNLKVKFV